jgi:hypothetical protein
MLLQRVENNATPEKVAENDLVMRCTCIHMAQILVDCQPYGLKVSREL